MKKISELHEKNIRTPREKHPNYMGKTSEDVGENFNLSCKLLNLCYKLLNLWPGIIKFVGQIKEYFYKLRQIFLEAQANICTSSEVFVYDFR